MTREAFLRLLDTRRRREAAAWQRLAPVIRAQLVAMKAAA